MKKEVVEEAKKKAEDTYKKSKEKIKEQNKKNIKRAKEEAGEFKKFISRGNVVDMAVGVIIGGGFGKIVTSLVNDIITPLIGIIIGGLDFSNLSIEIGNAKVAYGSFIQSIIDFLIIAICIFSVIRIFERFKHKEKKEEVEEIKKSDEVVLLEEIRDLLKDKQSKKVTTKKLKNEK